MSKNRKRIKYGFYGLLTLILSAVILLFIPYFVSPIYDFSEPKPFAGNRYYNPYQEMDTSWMIANFHAHSRSWGGFTDGKHTNIDSIFERYQQMGYTHIGISNYQKITYVDKENIASIPVYEHGFNVKKRHHLCLGAEKVSWLDFFFFQTLSHKQYVLNHLRSTTGFLTVNHPKFANGFEEADFSILSNYDAIEVLNHYRTSVGHWDSALSSGYYAVLLANDDMHKLNKMDEVSVNLTVVNTSSLARYDIIQTLKAGKHYGVKVHLKPDESYRVKTERNANLVHPTSISMQGDTLWVELDTLVSVIRFVGQGGKLKDTTLLSRSAAYIFDTTDTYIRIEIEDKDSNLYLFNPVVLSDSPCVVNTSRYAVNRGLTCLKRTAVLGIFLLIGFGLYYRKRNRYRQRIKTFLGKPYRIQFVVLLFCSIIIRAFVGANIELTNDEVYYRLFALFPDFSHFDHPPMTGWLIQLTTLNVLLDSDFFIRLGAIVLGSINLMLVFKIGEQIHGSRAGFTAAFLFCISPYVSLLAGTFILPDAPLLFFWLMSLRIAVSIFSGEPTKQKSNRLLLLGLCIGCALLSKYTAVFLWTGIGMYIVFFQRCWLKKWQLYLAVVISLICLLPVFYWNMKNDFISFVFHGGRLSLFSEVCFSCFGRELTGSFLYNNPFLFGMIYYVFFLSLFRKSRMSNYSRFFYCTGIPLVLMFLFFSLFRSILPHWSAPGYTALIFPVAVFITEKWEKGRKGLWIQAKIWGIILLLAAVLFGIQYRYGVLSLKDHDIPDFSIELSAWEKTGEAFSRLSESMEKQGKMQRNAPVIASRWYPAANLDRYVAKPSNRSVLTIGAIEDVHKYAWINPLRGGFSKGMDAWYITDDYDFMHPEEISLYFERISRVDTLHILRNGNISKNVYVYQLKNYLMEN
ncbi:MAG: glycosyltransferase family 39 protein [Bacteroidales bacterium]|jgi:hypothetical protein|nr:glycosyltransferase family 39 protein [Bacteroidales bacterium]